MNVELTEKEKRLIIGEVVSMATKAMFHHHYYKFGGTYHQTQGGPIGLLGTCVINHLAMQMFYVKIEYDHILRLYTA